MSHSPNVTQSHCHPVPMSHTPNVTQSLSVTQSQCHTQYIHSLSINPIHIALFNSTNLISQYFPSVQAVSPLPFLPNRYKLQHDFVYRNTIMSSWFTILPRLPSNSTAQSDQHTVLILLCQCTEIPYFQKILI